MKLSEHLDKGIWTLLDKGLLLLYGVGVILVVVNVLPQREWGVFSEFQVFFLILCALADSIFLQPMVKFASEHEAEVPDVLAASFNLYAGFMLIFGVAISFVSRWLGVLYKAPELATMLAYMPLLISLHIFRNVGIRYLQVTYRLKSIFLIDLALFGSIIVMAVVGSIMGWFKTAFDFMELNMIGGALSSLMAITLGRKDLLRMPLFRVPRGEYGRLINFAKFQAGTSALLTLQQWSDVLIVGFFWTPLEAAIFSNAKTIYRFLDAVREGATLLIVPIASKLYTAGERTSLRALVEKLLLLFFVVLVPASLFLLIFSDTIVRIIYKGVYNASSPVFQMLILGGFTLPLSLIATNVLIGIGKAKSLFLSTFGAVALFFVLSWILVPTMKSEGAALAVFVSTTALGLFTYFAMRKEVGISLKSMVGHGFAGWQSALKKITKD